ncbi:putative inorganic phosphate cotransporter [Trichogramma pretiosum]|uniref:putative inorganic phosphate cotransporter n=1 Tax=Trichogramma pretiosum TaxID=7493 RepID=UPI0006C95467|nr:putative inorganic phosphate cotransporter [Trichogramma pretiosum]
MKSDGAINLWKACCIHIPQRWIFALMGFLGLFNAYAMRACLSITITQMVVPTTHAFISEDETCRFNDTISTNTTVYPDVTSKGIYNWDETLQGIILSSFYWGYVITHIPGGMMAEKFGGKYTLGIGILLTAVFTLLTPNAVTWGGHVALIIIRILMGLGEGTTYPAVNVMLAQWTPPEERSKTGSFVFAGAPLGTVYATTVSGLILRYSSAGWPAVFYFFGSMNVLWFVVWVFVCYNNPQEHPFISEKEMKFLEEKLSDHTHKKPPPVPWRHILKSKPLWALIIALIGHNWAFLTIVSDLPKYMDSVLKYSIQNNGYLSSLAYLFMWIGSLITSFIADWSIAASYLTITQVRKIGSTIALIGPGLCIVGASYAGCDRVFVMVLFTVGMALMGTALPGIMVNVLDLSPNYAGTLMALTNGISALTGVVAPCIVGALTPHQTLSEWRLVFWIVFAVSILTNLIFLYYGSGKVEYWNDPEFVENDRKENKKTVKDVESK